MRRLIVFMVLSMVVVVACFLAHRITPGHDEAVAATLNRGYLTGLMTGIPENEVDGLAPDARTQLEQYGSTFTREAGGTYSWHFPFPDRRFSVVFGTYPPVVPAMDGGFALPVPALQLLSMAPHLLINGQTLKVPPALRVLSGQDGGLEVQLQYAFKDVGCSKHHKGSGHDQTGVCGSCTACIDNNGLWSFTGCKTSKWVGFTGSDCNVAWVVYGLCAYPNDPYCINGRNCSPLIGHSTCWHKG